MAMAAEEVAQDDVLQEVERLGGRLKEATRVIEETKAELYPALHQASRVKHVPLAKLAPMIGLTRGRVHQIVALVDMQKKDEPKDEPAPKQEEPEREPEAEKEPVAAQPAGWSL